ncbi:hypothetical protein [Thermus sediminis]|uniref:hypothetical protein n=1 Tax=Thermus sediminis TaxID=1761908 RepID=UPI000E3DA2BB|nr:hypothetical protein [Thermus sediminis]
MVPVAYRLALLLERLRTPYRLPKPPPAWVREYQEVRTPLRLDLPYYPAQGRGGLTLIPWDSYMEEVEAILTTPGRAGPRGD